MLVVEPTRLLRKILPVLYGIHLRVIDHRTLAPSQNHEAEVVLREGLGLTPREARLDDLRRDRGQRALHVAIDLGQAIVPVGGKK